MAMVDNFIKHGGYTIKKYAEDSNPFKKVDLEEREVEPGEGDDNDNELEDINDEEVIYLEDFDDSENEREESDDKTL